VSTKTNKHLSLFLFFSLCDYYSRETRDCDLRFAMASTAMRFSATSAGAEALPRRNSLAGFLTGSARSSAKSRLRFIGRSANLSFLRRRNSFSAVKCVSGSEARQTQHDPVAQQQGLKFLLLSLYIYICPCQCACFGLLSALLALLGIEFKISNV